MKGLLEQEYFTMKEKKSKFETSQSYLTYITIAKVWVLVICSGINAYLIVKALK